MLEKDVKIVMSDMVPIIREQHVEMGYELEGLRCLGQKHLLFRRQVCPGFIYCSESASKDCEGDDFDRKDCAVQPEGCKECFGSCRVGLILGT